MTFEEHIYINTLTIKRHRQLWRRSKLKGIRIVTIVT